MILFVDAFDLGVFEESLWRQLHETESRSDKIVERVLILAT